MILAAALLASVATTAGAATPPRLLSVEMNYPPAALRARAEGVAAFAVTLSKDGLVTKCAITQTSGNADLDRQTCVQLRRTARFAPATDARGQAVTGHYTGRLRWIIPPAAPKPLPSPTTG